MAQEAEHRVKSSRSGRKSRKPKMSEDSSEAAHQVAYVAEEYYAEEQSSSERRSRKSKRSAEAAEAASPDAAEAEARRERRARRAEKEERRSRRSRRSHEMAYSAEEEEAAPAEEADVVGAEDAEAVDAEDFAYEAAEEEAAPAEEEAAPAEEEAALAEEEEAAPAEEEAAPAEEEEEAAVEQANEAGETEEEQEEEEEEEQANEADEVVVPVDPAIAPRIFSGNNKAVEQSKEVIQRVQNGLKEVVDLMVQAQEQCEDRDELDPHCDRLQKTAAKIFTAVQMDAVYVEELRHHHHRLDDLCDTSRAYTTEMLQADQARANTIRKNVRKVITGKDDEDDYELDPEEKDELRQVRAMIRRNFGGEKRQTDDAEAKAKLASGGSGKMGKVVAKGGNTALQIAMVKGELANKDIKVKGRRPERSSMQDYDAMMNFMRHNKQGAGNPAERR